MRRFSFLLALFLLPAIASAAVTSSLVTEENATATSAVPVVATPPPQPVEDGTYHPVPDEFAAAVVYLPSKRRFLYEFKGDTPRSAASLTKLVSGLVLLRLGPAWSRIVAVLAKDEVGGGRLRVNAGARLTVRDLWFAAIGSSANNATLTLARVTGVSRTAFVTRMNKEAKAAGATQSRFVEPSGMEPTNVTTARDMARIADAAFRQPMMRLATTRATYRIAVRGERGSRELKTTLAPFVLDPDVWTLGGKTGYLEESQYNLVARLRDVDADGKPISGTDVVVVVLGAPDKEGSFASVKRLAEWAWDNHAF